MSRSVRRVSVSALAVAGLLFTLATPAHAIATTGCIGTVAHTKIVGDLVVPPGKSCHLVKASVTGRVIVSAGSHLNAQSVSMAHLIAQPNSKIEMGVSTLRGDLVADRATLIYLGGVTVIGSVVGSVRDLRISGAQINGRIDLNKPAKTDEAWLLVLDAVAVGQGVRADSISVYIGNSDIGKYLLVDETGLSGAPEGGHVAICKSRIAGDVTLKSADSPRVGTGDGITQCGDGEWGRTYDVVVDGSLLLLRSVGQRATLNGTFGGQLVCRGNNLLPWVFWAGAVTANGYIQQCAGLKPA